MRFSKLSRVHTNLRIAKNQTLRFEGETFHHLTTVLRMKTGQEFRIFNSVDGEFNATITNIEKKTFSAEIGDQLRQVRPEKPLTLGLCLIKPEKFLMAVNSTIQLGVTKIIPIISARTQFKSINREKTEKIITEATEQSERFLIAKLLEPIALEDFIDDHQFTQIIFANEDEAKLNLTPTVNIENNVAILIGPEGGFSETEKQLLLASPKVLSTKLGNNVLRSEVAATCLISWVNYLRMNKVQNR